MAILFLTLAIVYICLFASRLSAQTNFNSVPLAPTSSVLIKPNKYFVGIALLSLILVSGLRENIGDTYFYIHIYEMNDFTWEYISSQKDIGFGILQKILKSFSDDAQVMIFTTALFTNLLIMIVLYKYSRMLDLSIYVYITSGAFLVSMNGIRQVLAAAIIFTATKFLIEGSWKRYILVVLFASTFHQSALILIPIYFLVRFIAWSKATFILLGFSIVIVIGFEQFSSLLFTAIQDTQYAGYESFAEGGANFIRVIVTSAPLFIAYIGREKLRAIFPKSDYIVNMALIGCAFMIISTQNWIFARFSIYFSLYNLILISWIVKVFREKDQKFIYYAILVCYFIYFFYEHVITLNIMYSSRYLR